MVEDIEFRRTLANMADRNRAGMAGMDEPNAFKFVEAICADSEVVIGVWKDIDEPCGVGLYPIKGANRLRESVAATTCRINAVPCASLLHAIAAERRFGDKVN